MATGRIVHWVEDRGFGFIDPDDGSPDIFFHRFALADQSWTPHIGAPVRYARGVRPRDGRDRAVDVVRVE
jgi:cold shock CspA family protein